MQAYHTYKDERNLFMILEYVPGGELLSDARNCFDNDTAKFYAAQLVMALQYLHADNIIYRGLVPDNLLIDRSGYIKLVDFGFAKQLHATTAGEGPLTHAVRHRRVPRPRDRQLAGPLEGRRLGARHRYL